MIEPFLIYFDKLWHFFILGCSKANSQQYFRVQPQDVSVLVGENITVPCVIATPHGDVQWTKDGLALGM